MWRVAGRGQQEENIVHCGVYKVIAIWYILYGHVSLEGQSLGYIHVCTEGFQDALNPTFYSEKKWVVSPTEDNSVQESFKAHGPGSASWQHLLLTSLGLWAGKKAAQEDPQLFKSSGGTVILTVMLLHSQVVYFCPELVSELCVCSPVAAKGIVDIC